MATTLNIDDELRRLRRAEPFLPFSIVTAQGERHLVESGRLFLFDGDRVLVVRPKRPNSNIFYSDIVGFEMAPLGGAA